MFAVVRTGGKQYRVALGDKIVVEKVAGDAGQRIDITDVLLAGEGSELKSVDGLTVGAEIIAQAKGDKVTVFKKRRRHNYRRKKGHRQQHTILRIVAIGDQKAEKKPAVTKAEKPAKAEKPPAADKPAKAAAAEEPQVDAPATENPAPADETPASPAKAKAAKPKKAAAAAEDAGEASTKKDAPAKGAAEKSTKSKPTKAK
jgi:large subunit ribosomal protein L21